MIKFFLLLVIPLATLSSCQSESKPSKDKQTTEKDGSKNASVVTKSGKLFKKDIKYDLEMKSKTKQYTDKDGRQVTVTTTTVHPGKNPPEIKNTEKYTLNGKTVTREEFERATGTVQE